MILVIAGTPVDTNMGISLLKKQGYKNLKSLAVANNPIEQTLFQTSSVQYKEQVMTNYLKKYKKQGIQKVFVYCNSLSAAVDFDKLSVKLDLKIITPLQTYKFLAHKFRNIFIFSANAQGLAGIEKVMLEGNKNVNIQGLTLLELVEAIEQKENPEKIAERFNFKTLAKYINLSGVDSFVLGCTHFPYVEEELKKYITVEIINPEEDMVNRLAL